MEFDWIGLYLISLCIVGEFNLNVFKIENMFTYVCFFGLLQLSIDILQNKYSIAADTPLKAFLSYFAFLSYYMSLDSL